MRRRAPSPAVEILSALGFVKIVGRMIPGAKWGVIVTGAGHVEIVRVKSTGTDGRLRGIAWSATGHRASGQAANQHQPDALAPFHRRLVKAGSTQHRRRNDDAHPENHCRGNDCGRDILVLEDFLVKIARRAFVEQLVTENRRGDAYGREEQHIANGSRESLRVPSGRGRGFGGIQRDGREEDHRE